MIIDYDRRLLQKFYFNSKSGRRSFSYAAPRFWNSLNEDIRLLNDTIKFKANIKTVLYTNANNIVNAGHGYAM